MSTDSNYLSFNVIYQPNADSGYVAVIRGNNSKNIDTMIQNLLRCGYRKYFVLMTEPTDSLSSVDHYSETVKYNFYGYDVEYYVDSVENINIVSNAIGELHNNIKGVVVVNGVNIRHDYLQGFKQLRHGIDFWADDNIGYVSCNGAKKAGWLVNVIASVGELRSVEQSSIKKALFLDRDGVVNIDYDYVHTVEEFDWTKNIIKAIEYAIEKGYYIFVITNQSGIGRGRYSSYKVWQLHNYISEQLNAEYLHIDGFHMCPHKNANYVLPEYRVDCQCRKPNPLMIDKFASDWGIDKSSSVMFGDKNSDREASLNAGVGKFCHVAPDADLLELAHSFLV